MADPSQTDPTTGLSSAEAAARLRRHGPNEVPEERRHPLRTFLSKSWGVSAWMIELVAVVSLLLHRTADVVLVPGDVLRVRAGDFVPADARLLDGDLAVDESALTGISLAVALVRGFPLVENLALLYFALFFILSIRGRSRFWHSAPSRILALSVAVDGVVGFLLPFADLPGLRPIPVVQTLTIVGDAAVASLLVNDAVKAAVLRRMGLRPAAAGGE